MELPASLKDWVGVVGDALKALGIIAAGVWAYVQYFRGRVYKARLRTKVAGQELYNTSSHYLLVRMEVENKGLSKVPIEQSGTGLRVLVHSDWDDPSKTEHLETLTVFEEHEWIEPGETIEDEEIVKLPGGNLLAVRLEFFLISRDNSWATLNTVPINLEKKDAKQNEGRS